MHDDRSVPRVAIIEPVGGHGGMNFYDFELARGLSHAGVESTLYTCDETEPVGVHGFELVRPFKRIFGAAHPLVRALRYFRGILQALRHARRSQARIAHFHFFHSSALEFLSILLARIYDMRIVITVHDVQSFAGGGRPWKSRLLFRLGDALIAHNGVSRDELIETVGVDPEKVHLIPSGNYCSLAADAPAPDEARALLDLPASDTLFLFFGQIKKVKALDLLLEAFPEVLRVDPRARLVIAGRVWKDDYSAYQAQIDSLGLQGTVIERIGFVPDHLVSAYYAAADVVVLPYRKIYQSAVLLMAMSHGRPVVVSDLPGMTEIVTDGETGVVFRSGHCAHLSSALIQMANSPELRKQVAVAARDLMENVYTWDRVGYATAKVYLKVMQS